MRAIDKLRAAYSKKTGDVILHYPMGSGTRSDAHGLSGIFSEAVTTELDERGYDLATLRFSIEPKQGNVEFASQRGAT